MNSLKEFTAALENKARMCDLNLRNAVLSGLDLSAISADRLDLRSVNFGRSKIRRARFFSCLFDDSFMESVDCFGAIFRLCSFDHVRASGACIDGARIENCSVQGANFSNASLSGVQITETSFARSCMQGAVLDSSEGEGVEFRGSDLRNVTMTDAKLEEADFCGADLRGADLSLGVFRGADFRGALLGGTRFDGADCSGARFDMGAGPRENPTAGRSSVYEPFGNQSLDKELVAFFGDTLNSVFESYGKAGDESGDCLADSFDLFQVTTVQSYKMQREWAESLIGLVQGEWPPDIETLAAILVDGPFEVKMPSVLGNTSKQELIRCIKKLLESLKMAENPPPDEIKNMILQLSGDLGLKPGASLQDILMHIIKGGDIKYSGFGDKRK